MRPRSGGRGRLVTLHQICEAAKPAVVDVVFVHGLNENWESAWGFDQLANLGSFVSDDVPQANVWSLDYRVDWTWWKGGSTSMFDRALGVLAELDYRLGAGDRPIVLVGHSYGGLLIKKLFQVGENSDRYGRLIERMKSVAFFAVPHNGAAIAAYAQTFKRAFRTSIAVSELRTNAADLRQLALDFRRGVKTRSLDVLVFRELLPTHGVMVVDQGDDPQLDGVEPIGVDLNHNEIVLVENADEMRVGRLIEMVRRAAGISEKAELASFPPSFLGRVLRARSDAEVQTILLEMRALAGARSDDVKLRQDYERLRRQFARRARGAAIGGFEDAPRFGPLSVVGRLLVEHSRALIVAALVGAAAAGLIGGYTLYLQLRSPLPIVGYATAPTHVPGAALEPALYSWEPVSDQLWRQLTSLCNTTNDCSWAIDTSRLSWLVTAAPFSTQSGDPREVIARMKQQFQNCFTFMPVTGSATVKTAMEVDGPGIQFADGLVDRRLWFCNVRASELGFTLPFTSELIKPPAVN